MFVNMYSNSYLLTDYSSSELSLEATFPPRPVPYQIAVSYLQLWLNDVLEFHFLRIKRKARIVVDCCCKWFWLALRATNGLGVGLLNWGRVLERWVSWYSCIFCTRAWAWGFLCACKFGCVCWIYSSDWVCWDWCNCFGPLNCCWCILCGNWDCWICPWWEYCFVVVVAAADHESFVVAVVVEKFLVVICFVEVYISVVPEEVVAA